MRIWYFSSGPRERVLEAILAAGHEVAGVFITNLDRWPRVLPTVALAELNEIPVETVNRDDITELGCRLRDGIVFSAGFAFIFPREFLAGPRLCLNLHGTLLPKYRGARTLNWVIERGEVESGVTVHRIDEGIDTGPILLQRSFPLSPFETGRSLYHKTLVFESSVAVEALAKLDQGVAIFTPQANEIETLPNRIPDHSRLDPGRSLTELLPQIRAADPEAYPAHFFVDGEKVCVRIWRPDKPTDESSLV
jgi:methionyl-tRNA formyltransferase